MSIIEQVKDLINKVENADEKGKWVTIKGTHIFIPEGKTVDEVIDQKWKERTKSYSEAKDHAKKQLELVESKLKENNSPKKHDELVSDKKELEDRIKYYEEREKEEKGEGKSETKKESNTTKDTKKHIDRIEKLIKKYNLEPHEEDDLLDELGSFEAKLDEGLEPREEEELREQLFDFEEDIKRHQEMKKDESKGYSLSEKYKNHVQFDGDKESGGYPRKIHKDLESAKEFYKSKKEGQEGAEKVNLERSGKRGISLRDNPVIVKNPLGEGYIVATSGLAQKHNLTEVYPVDRTNNSLENAFTEALTEIIIEQ